MTAFDIDTLVDTVCTLAVSQRGDVVDVVSGHVDRLAPLAVAADRAAAIARAVARLDGLDALELHLADPDVDEVMVNAGREVWVDRRGVLQLVGSMPAGVVDVVLERVLAPTGKRLDRTRPIVDVRLENGARLCAAVAPVAVDGTCVSIRKHRPQALDLDAFTDNGDVRNLLATIVTARCNVLVSGATSSGKTTLLAALLRQVARCERLVVCEDTTELDLPDRHAVRLEARPHSVDGTPGVDPIELVRTALRLRPDRLVVGEFRGSEVLAAIGAMNTGHDGSLSTCHANSAVDALRRVETLVMQAAPAWPLPAIRRQVTRSIDVVIHVERAARGRRVSEVAEVIESADEPAVRRLADSRGVCGTLTRTRKHGDREEFDR